MRLNWKIERLELMKHILMVVAVEKEEVMAADVINNLMEAEDNIVEIKTYDIVKEVDMKELKGESMPIVEEKEVNVVVVGEIEAADRTIVVDTIEVVD